MWGANNEPVLNFQGQHPATWKWATTSSAADGGAASRQKRRRGDSNPVALAGRPWRDVALAGRGPGESPKAKAGGLEPGSLGGTWLRRVPPNRPAESPSPPTK